MTKKKTVKELNEEFIIFQANIEERLAKLDMFKDVFAKLSDIDLKELEMKAQIMNDANDVSKLKMMENKIEENSMCLQNLLSKTKENVDDVAKTNRTVIIVRKVPKLLWTNQS